MTFGPMLRSLRETQGWTEARLADVAGVDASTVARLERGQRVPSRALVMALARGLGLRWAGLARLLVAAGYVPDGAIVLVDDEWGGAATVHDVAGLRRTQAELTKGGIS